MRQLLDRIGTAIRILFGREPTWWGIQSEWAEIQVGAANLFRKHNALAARLSKQIDELGAQEEDCGCQEEEPAPASIKDRKAAIRARVWGTRMPVGNGVQTGPTDDSEIPPTGRWVPDTGEDDE